MLRFFSRKYKVTKEDKTRIQQLRAHCQLYRIPIRNYERLNTALTHVSCRANLDSYERLEFLGDSVVGLCLADILYKNNPKLSEGKMSALKSRIVDEKSLAQAARELNLLPLVLLGQGERLKDHRAQEKVLCDVFEALVAVLYLDHGYACCLKFISRLFLDKIQLTKEIGVSEFKTVLQKISVRAYKSYPIYKVLHTEGPEHGKIFYIQGILNKFEASAKGRTKKEAEQLCAQEILQKIAKFAAENPESSIAREFLNEKKEGLTLLNKDE